MNASVHQRFPVWYIVNDAAVVLCSVTTIGIGLAFVLLVVRERKLRTIMNILSSNSCVCAALVAGVTIWDASYMLKADVSRVAREDRYCVVRSVGMLVTMAALNYSLCIQTYHRLITIVYCQQVSFRSVNLYVTVMVVQWLTAPTLMLPIMLSGKVVYQSGSFLCQISFADTALFLYVFGISYLIPVIFIVGVHIRIAHHIKHHWQTRRPRLRSGKYGSYPKQRIVLLIFVLIISYSPCGVFFIIEHLRITVVPYAQKLVLLFASLSFSLMTTLTFLFNRSVRGSSLLLHYENRPIIGHFVRRSTRRSIR